MSTWEERMAQRALQRSQQRAAEEQAAEAIRNREQAEADRLEQQREHDAGPPCAACYVWAKDFFSCSPYLATYSWVHGWPAVPAAGESEYNTDWCRHECHGDEAPVYCGPIAIA